MLPSSYKGAEVKGYQMQITSLITPQSLFDLAFHYLGNAN